VHTKLPELPPVTLTDQEGFTRNETAAVGVRDRRRLRDLAALHHDRHVRPSGVAFVM
jgi:hypothetical protein